MVVLVPTLLGFSANQACTRRDEIERAEFSEQKLWGAIAGSRNGLENVVIRGDGEEGGSGSVRVMWGGERKAQV